MSDLLKLCAATFELEQLPQLSERGLPDIQTHSRLADNSRIDYLLCGMLGEYLTARMNHLDVERHPLSIGSESIADSICGFLFRQQLDDSIWEPETPEDATRRIRTATILQEMYRRGEQLGLRYYRPEVIYITFLGRSADWLFDLPASRYGSLLEEIQELTMVSEDESEWCLNFIGNTSWRRLFLWNIPNNDPTYSCPPLFAAIPRYLPPSSSEERVQMFAAARRALQTRPLTFKAEAIYQRALKAIGKNQVESHSQEVLYAFVNSWAARKHGSMREVLYEHADYSEDDNPFGKQSSEEDDKLHEIVLENLRLRLKHHGVKCPREAADFVVRTTIEGLRAIEEPPPVMMFDRIEG